MSGSGRNVGRAVMQSRYPKRPTMDTDQFKVELSGDCPVEIQRAAVNRVLRTAKRGVWTRQQIVDTLNALGLGMRTE